MAPRQPRRRTKRAALLWRGFAGRPKAVATIRDLIYWQHAKMISESAGFSKTKWSISVRVYVKEKEKPNECIYCGSKQSARFDSTLH